MPPSQTAVTLAATSLSRRFGPRLVVEDVSLELKRGEVLGLLGPNGAGKTTTMRMLTGNLAPTSGSVQVCGLDLLEHPLQAKVRLGYLPETAPLYRDLTVNDYLLFAARLHRVPRPQQRAAVRAAEERCGLVDVGGRLIGALSRGYQQRVGIAQAIVHQPDVLVLDEPTVGLDPNQIRDIRALMRELGRAYSVILSTHILSEVESVCDRVQILHQGRLVFDDTLAALNRGRGKPGLVVGLHKPPALEELAAIPGVSGVERLSSGEFRLLHSDNADPTPTLVELAASRGWELYQLAPSTPTLEDVFVQITMGENGSGLAAAATRQPEAAQ